MGGSKFNKVREKICDAAVQTVLCGKEDTVRVIPHIDQPSRKEIRRLRRKLDASEDWQRDGDVVYNAHGVSFQGIASWGDQIDIRLDGYDHRFKVLYLDRFMERKAYLLPVNKSAKCLPDIDLGDGELQYLIEMANAISNQPAGREYLYILKNPLRPASQARILESTQLDWDSEEFLVLLERHLELLPILTAALDSQLRALKKLRSAPVGLYNFLCPQKDAAAQEWLLSVMRAVTFSTETSEYPGPIMVQDLAVWNRCYRRFAVINATSRELIRPILNDLQERDQMRKCGDCPPPFAPTLPVSVSKSAICSPFCVDVRLPRGLAPLSGRQMDLLRLAMGKVLSTKTADKACEKWEDQMRSPSAYRWSGFEVWRNVLAGRMVKAWFDTDEQRGRAANLFRQSQQQQDAEAQVRSAAISSAYEYLANPARYEDRIADRPATKGSADELLSDEFFAFCFDPAAGPAKGSKLLAFNKDSLRRLLRSINVGDENYDAVLDFCEKEGLLVKRDHSITLGNETFHGITFKRQM